jgi:protoporphyrin/coproporphyrin ferrochelatase
MVDETARETIGVLVMAYGTADGPDDIERYYTDIRGGRPPTPEHLSELKERYAAIGNVFPLLEITKRQAEGIERSLNGAAAAAGDDVEFKAYLGMKHSPPFIPEGVARMREDGVRRAVAVAMAPHWSGMSIETYIDRVQSEVAERGGPSFGFIRGFHDNPEFISLLADRVERALGSVAAPARERMTVVFSAHSLPVRTSDDGRQWCKHCRICEVACRYPVELRRTADLVARRLGLRAAGVGYTTGWQSAGRTPDPWFGPTVEELIRESAAAGRTAVVVCSAGFVADHLEILYDLDIEAAGIARDAGIAFARTEMPNDDPGFVSMLAEIVRAHVPERSALR